MIKQWNALKIQRCNRLEHHTRGLLCADKDNRLERSSEHNSGAFLMRPLSCPLTSSLTSSLPSSLTRLIGLLMLGYGMTACTSTTPTVSTGHLQKPVTTPPAVSNVPPLAMPPMYLPKPKPQKTLERYSVVVHNANVNDLLFALARDAKINIDIHPSIQGLVTLNVIDQTLPQILERVANQVDIRYDLVNGALIVQPDLPYLQHYKIDYVNMTRETQTSVAVATQIATTGQGAGGSGGSSGSGNNSTTELKGISKNAFWESLEKNVKDLLRETDKVLPEGSSEITTKESKDLSGSGTGNPTTQKYKKTTPETVVASSPNPTNFSENNTTVSLKSNVREASSVIVNAESGLVSVRATARQQDKVKEFLDQVMNSAQRQVLIEATIVEVQLSDQYQQGINWQRLRLDGTGWGFLQQPMGSAPLPGGSVPGQGPGGNVFAQPFPGAEMITNTLGAANPSMFVLRYLNAGTSIGNIGAAVSLLESYGKVKVLSSPKLSVLNNQTAMMKVVDNKVYFTVSANVTPATSSSAAIITYNTTLNTVPIGFVMSVTPQISSEGLVNINLRPTISRIVSYVNDPSPVLAQANVVSRVPEVQTRELESIMRVASGDVAVLGGLMQDTVNNSKDQVPGLGDVPLVGNLFKYKNDVSTKTELVIFLRPIVIRDASLKGDFSSYTQFMPSQEFFTKPSDFEKKWQTWFGK